MKRATTLTPTDFEISAKTARSVTKLRDEAARTLPNPLLGLAINPEGVPFFFINLLGGGEYGSAYSASVDSPTTTPTHVIKQVNIISQLYTIEMKKRNRRTGSLYDETELNDIYAEQEYAMSIIIRRRLGEEACRERFVCAIDRFYNKAHTLGFIVFPFVTTMTLEKYILQYHKPAFDKLQALLQSGATVLQQNTTFDNISKVAAQNDADGKIARDLWEQYVSFITQSLNLSLQLAEAFSLLHSKSIYHKDVKPDNILYNMADDKLRLIDFGLACAVPTDDDPLQSNEPERELAHCTSYYSAAFLYTDPLAHFLKLQTKEDINFAFARFDEYAIGKIIQLIFDPLQSHENVDWIVIRKSVRKSIHELVVTMTGERDYVPPKDSPFGHNLTAQKVAEGKKLFLQRPTMAQITDELSVSVDFFRKKVAAVRETFISSASVSPSMSSSATN